MSGPAGGEPMGRVTDVTPAGMVPAAWLVTIAAHVSAVTTHTLFVALVVMDVLLAAFFVAGRREMTGPVLRVWLGVLVAGLVVNLIGTVDMALDPANNPLVSVTLYGWMALPGLAYLRTGQLVRVSPYRLVYLCAGALSLVGTTLYAAGWLELLTAGVLGGLVVVGVGQSVGMVAATVQNLAVDGTDRA